MIIRSNTAFIRFKIVMIVCLMVIVSCSENRGISPTQETFLPTPTHVTPASDTATASPFVPAATPTISQFPPDPCITPALPEGAYAQFGATGNIGQIAFSPDGEQIAILNPFGIYLCRADFSTQIWASHLDSPLIMAWSPDGKMLATSLLLDHSILLLDATTGELIQSLKANSYYGDWQALDWSPDGETIAAVGDITGSVVYWSTSSGNGYVVESQCAISGFLNDVAWSPNRKYIAAIPANATEDNTELYLWDPKTGDCLNTIKGVAQALSFTWLPDSETIAISKSQAGITLYNALTGMGIRKIQNAGSAYTMLLAPDGKTLVTSDASVWDVATGRQMQSLQNQPHPKVFTPDGSMIVSELNGSLGMWDIANGEPLQTLFEGEDSDQVVSLSWSPDERILAAGSNFGGIALWDVGTKRHLRTFADPDKVGAQMMNFRLFSIAWSPDGKAIAAGWAYSNLNVYDAETGDAILSINFEGLDNVYRVAWSPDAKTIAAGLESGTVVLWDANTGERLRYLVGHTSSVSCLSWSPDGSTILSGSLDGTVNIWNPKTGEHLRTLEGNEKVLQISWSPNGDVIAAGTDSFDINLWDVTTGEQVAPSLHWNPGGYLTGSVAWSPAGLLASGLYEDGEEAIAIWEPDIWTPSRIIGKGYDASILAWSPNGNYLAAAGSPYGTIVLWDIRDMDTW